MGSVVEYKTIPSIVAYLQGTNKTVALVGGHFDLLHIGHINFLRCCKQVADFLVVYLPNDQTTIKIKGQSRPIIPVMERVQVIASLEMVDYTVVIEDVIDASQVYMLDRKLIEEIKPNYYICVSEGPINTRIREIQKPDNKTEIVILPRQSLIWSTSKLVEDIQNITPAISEHYLEPDDYTLSIVRSRDEEMLFYFDTIDGIASKSSCKIRQVGAIIVKDGVIIGQGFNRLPAGVKDCWCKTENTVILPGQWHFPCFALHAEQVAVFDALEKNKQLGAATLYVTSCPCIQCAKIVIEFGFAKVIYLNEYTTTDGRNLLLESGIEVLKFDGIKV